MASCAGALADRPRLVLKKRSEIWKYFGYEADCEGKPIDTQRPVCKACFKATQAKGGNTSNMAKDLSDRHPELFREFKERQVSKCY